jgi:hypothetical protein
MDTRSVRVYQGAQPNDTSGLRIQQGMAGDGGYRWIPPVVQKVKVPPMIRGGVYIPQHESYVIINDAAYVADDDRMDGLRRKYAIPSGTEIVSPMRKSDVVVAVFRLNKVFAESAVVPNNKVAFLMQGKAIDRALALGNDEVTQVGNYLVSMNRDKGDDFVSVTVVESGLKSVKAYSVSQSQMLFLSNGYILAPLFERSKRRDER